MQILTDDEEKSLVALILKYSKARFPPTRTDICTWVENTLRLRQHNNEYSGRKSLRLSPPARKILSRGWRGRLHQAFFEGLQSRNPELQPLKPSARTLSFQRANAVTPENRDILFHRREEALGTTGIRDPATGKVDPSRIFSSDECPNPVDSVPKGNNVEHVYCAFFEMID